ncbi:coiled-coil domain-containing protein [Sphingomonas baiyangensis]|uniref:ATPase n=1 Tax=Sphingomonas baiyangensis TaxID=2572576 RepID=A0A4V6WRF4_9SPHN|nr:hypothetical protein [Sphingomonas baiyangensis]TKD50828.1 hypothetical protein FBR43_08660 [Sphingomonas baiyangensis]
MNGGSRIIDLRHGSADDVPEAIAPQAWAEPDYDEDDPPAPPTPANGWIAPALAAAAFLGWLGFAVWVLLPVGFGAGLLPVAMIQLIAALCVPPVLIGILWLVARGGSRAEAARFARTSAAMRNDAAELEVRIAALADRIEANRALLNEQAHALIAAGEETSERLSGASNAMVSDVASVHAAARTLGDSSDAAGKRLAVLLAQMPRANGEIQSMAATLDQLGLASGEKVSALDAQLAMLAERARVADDVTGAAAQRLAAHIARMEATSESAGARLEAVTEQTSQAVDAVLDRAAQAIDEARRGIAAQGDALAAMLRGNQSALDEAARENMTALAGRLATIDEAITRIAETLDHERGQADALFETLDANVAAATARLDLLHETGTQRAGALAQSVAAVTANLDGMAEAMRHGDATGQTTIATAETLMTALDAAVREIDETLPGALERLDARVGESRAIVAAAKPELLSLVTAAESTHDAIEAINQTVHAQRDTLTALSAALVEALGTGSQRIATIETDIDGAIARSRDFADESAPALLAAIAAIRTAATDAADHARTALDAVVPAAADRLHAASADALARAIDGAVAQQMVRLTEATEDAVAAAQRASERVGQQMHLIAEASARIETRIEQAEAAREHAEHESFGRRVSLLIEALNSASIDIAKALSSDVSDSAWAAYLKGDRGVFTRRAVRLIEPGQLREIAHLYDADDAFREQVNRYIHDFEAMLRQVLAQRDGSPLGVTLLSSDNGKLYVALAQAIERLRA